MANKDHHEMACTSGQDEETADEWPVAVWLVAIGLVFAAWIVAFLLGIVAGLVQRI